jgi:hypothetical protein
MTCLYASDYGPADPVFDPLAGGGRLLRGFESQRSELSRAQNLGQLQAMERQLHRGESIAWCDQGYAWAEGPAVEGFLLGFSMLVVLPYAVKRLAPRLWRRSFELAQRVHESPSRLPNRTAYPGGQ